MTARFDKGTLAEAVNALKFVSTPILREGGHAWPFSETLASAKRCAKHIPITRVANLTPLNRLGIPTWSAITPLAKDLTVHAGKGETHVAAKLSAMMEAIERICAEEMPLDRVAHISFMHLRENTCRAVLNPEDLNLPFETLYQPDRSFGWVLGMDIARGEPVWVPTDAVLSPATDGLLTGVETNGLASGNTVTEATLHALYELIERDAASLKNFSIQHSDAQDRVPRLKQISPKNSDSKLAFWVERISRENIRTFSFDITTDFGVPVVETLLVDPDFQGTGQTANFVGHGCALDCERAYIRSLLEAVQAYSVLVGGARETYDSNHISLERTFSMANNLECRAPVQLMQWTRRSESTGDMLADLNILVSRLSAVGLDRCIVVDLTRRILEIPVVRVIVPGLECPYGFTTRRPGPRLLEHLV